MFKILSGAALGLGVFAHARAVVDLKPIGPHYPVLTIEKNEHPQNIMIAYVELNKDCSFKRDPLDDKKPLFGFYWLMDRARYKPVHPLILSGIRDRLELVRESADHHSFVLRLNELRKLKTDLPSQEVTITASRTGQECAAEADMKLPGDGVVRLEKIYSEASKSVWPPFRKLNSITLTGVRAPDARTTVRTYTKR